LEDGAGGTNSRFSYGIRRREIGDTAVRVGGSAKVAALIIKATTRCRGEAI
jgi:hypothetical protein